MFNILVLTYSGEHTEFIMRWTSELMPGSPCSECPCRRDARAPPAPERCAIRKTLCTRWMQHGKFGL